MRILYFAKDAPFVNSGYGKCCREICTRLKTLGHEVAVFATIGNQSSFLFEWNGLKIYPGAGDIFGEDVFLDTYYDWDAELLITQVDVWALKKISEAARIQAINWLPYAPVDSFPVPESITEPLRNAVHVITMNNWAKFQLEEFGIHSTAIHHGIDSKIFRILNDDKEKLKLELGFPKDCFLIGMVQANQFLRKALEEQFLAIKIFREKHPQINVKVYCLSQQYRSDSFHLPTLAHAIGINDIIKFPTEYSVIRGIPEEQLSRIYNSFDVLLSATNGEGFGLPVIEAQGCGVPVVATDCMSFPELLLFGALCKVKGWMLCPSMLSKAIPDEFDIAEKLWLVYNTTYDKKELSYHAHYNWDWESRIIQEWMWELDYVRELIEYKCMKIPQPSKELVKRSKETVYC